MSQRSTNVALALLSMFFLGCGQDREANTPAEAEQAVPVGPVVEELNVETTPPPVDARPALPFPPDVALESQCGVVNDQQDVEFYNGDLGVPRLYVDDHEISTVQFQWLDAFAIEDTLGPGSNAGNVGGERWCSGTIITDHLILTAGHCFDIQQIGWITPTAPTSTGLQPVTPEVIATLQQVNFNYQIDGATGSVREGISVPIIRLLEYRLGNLDFAIVETEAIPEVSVVGVGTVGQRAPSFDEQIVIIQHPQGKPKKVDAGSVLHVTSNDVFYDNVDTHGGSSGSGVRDISGAVIGVHTNGGCTISGGANRGVNIESIRNVSTIL